jgi:dTDP-4-dehydrorhamnose 3,5-epimerase
MKITPLELDGAMLIEGVRHGDARGWFEEIWPAAKLAAAGFDIGFVQDNVSFSAEAGTLRGLHCQTPPFAQGKLVGPLTGAIRDVLVDIRPGSATYGRHLAIDLTAAEPRRVYVPEGFLHGFVTTAPDTLVHYKVTAGYSADHDRSVAWNDPELAIDWGVDAPTLSAKDAAAPRLKDAGALFGPAGA